MSAHACTAQPTLTSPSSSSVAATVTTFLACERCVRCFDSHDLVVAHVRNTPSHAAALAQSVANGGNIEAFIGRIITVMETVPDAEAYPFWPILQGEDIKEMADDEVCLPVVSSVVWANSE